MANALVHAGYDHAYARLYVKVETGRQCGNNCTKVFAFYGNRIDNQWSGIGQAGNRPNGTDWFYTALVTLNWYRQPDPGELIFYSYFPEMTQAPDGMYWANFFFQNDPREAIQPGRWYCLELELQANTPGAHDGFQRMWIDGVFKGGGVEYALARHDGRQNQRPAANLLRSRGCDEARVD